MKKNMKTRESKFLKRKLGCTDGFTLIEIIVVIAVTIVFVAFIITNFSRVRSLIPSTTAGLIADIRIAKSRAISGRLFDGLHRCGYGIKFQADKYFVYAGPQTDTDSCASDSRQFDNTTTTPIFLEVVLTQGLSFATVGDLYFEPPLPITYIDGATGAGEKVIMLKEAGAGCPSPGCSIVYINASGRIRQ